MLGRRQELNLQFQQIADGLCLSVAFWLAHALRVIGGVWLRLDTQIGPFAEFQWLLFVIMPFGPIILEMQGFYSHPLQKTFPRSLAQVARAGFWLGLFIAMCSFFFRLDVPSRAVMPLFAVIGGLFVLGRERLSIQRFRRRAKTEALRERIIVAGTTADMHSLRQHFTAEQATELEVVAEIDIETRPISEFVEALHTHSVSRVVFAGGRSHLDRLEEAIAACEIEGVEAWLIADFIRTSIARPDFDVFGVRPVLVFRTTPELSWALLVKELTDRLGAIFGLIVCTPLFILIGLAIKLTSPGPIFFRQARGGRYGRPFTMLKFRTMVTDAEMQREELARFNQMTGPVFKIDKDPRITPIGKFLRRTSLDELPQFWNVFRGEMSLVGPRPLPVYEVEKFETPAQRRRLSMKPGLTCLWQVAGRNQIKNFEQWVALDLQYIDNWSLWLDFKILVRTVPVVLFGWGAR